MKALSAGVKVGILTLITLIGAYAIWKSIGERAVGDDAYPLYAKFRDASGLPVGSQVVVAGLPVGEVTDLSIEGRLARVDLVVRGDIVIWSNAVGYKKSTSLLGSYYIEIDPGGPVSENGTQNRRLERGEQIPIVVEATTPDELFRRMGETMPRVDEVLISVRGLSEDVRQLVKGPIANTANRIDDLVQNQSDTVASILERTDRTLARIEQITGDIRNVTQSADTRVNSILAELEEA
ncbi:MAG TPA: MlaD family protein, partial [Kofleriaceae bacterium]|nr:MlaD family protein [Kofleriaceae bacterium]